VEAVVAAIERHPIFNAPYSNLILLDDDISPYEELGVQDTPALGH